MARGCPLTASRLHGTRVPTFDRHEENASAARDATKELHSQAADGAWKLDPVGERARGRESGHRGAGTCHVCHAVRRRDSRDAGACHTRATMDKHGPENDERNDDLAETCTPAAWRRHLKREPAVGDPTPRRNAAIGRIPESGASRHRRGSRVRQSPCSDGAPARSGAWPQEATTARLARLLTEDVAATFFRLEN